jgi:hypothetical protein
MKWRPPRKRRPENPVLRFSPYAWAKLLYFCHAGDTEIGGFGVASDPKELLIIDDFVTVRQTTTPISVVFDDRSVADYFEAQVDLGRRPGQFARVWLHTHPGDCAYPSGTDEQTFERVFRGCDWAVMFILARGGQTYCRLRFNTGPGGQVELPVEVDYSERFAGSDHEGWRDEYELNVQPEMDPLEPGMFGADITAEGLLQLGHPGEAFDIDCADALLDVMDERGRIELMMDEFGVDEGEDLSVLLGDHVADEDRNGKTSGGGGGGGSEVVA